MTPVVLNITGHLRMEDTNQTCPDFSPPRCQVVPPGPATERGCGIHTAPATASQTSTLPTSPLLRCCPRQTRSRGPIARTVSPVDRTQGQAITRGFIQEVRGHRTRCRRLRRRWKETQCDEDRKAYQTARSHKHHAVQDGLRQRHRDMVERLTHDLEALWTLTRWALEGGRQAPWVSAHTRYGVDEPAAMARRRAFRTQPPLVSLSPVGSDNTQGSSGRVPKSKHNQTRGLAIRRAIPKPLAVILNHTRKVVLSILTSMLMSFLKASGRCALEAWSRSCTPWMSATGRKLGQLAGKAHPVLGSGNAHGV